jgi:2-keto-4-pentenoate hydratase/2-oxohepta-3-ene-1,7-dioic acid hydratase in catechol pathway
MESIMRLVRYGEKGQEKPGLLDAAGNIRDLSGHISDIAGETLSDRGIETLRQLDPQSLPHVTGSPRLGPCVTAVSKVIGVAINYRLHGLETQSKLPTEPTLFLKAPSAIAGAYDDIILPRGSEKTDWEVELGLVIGKIGSNITASEAFDHVAGYCVLDDVSERAFQLERGGQQHTKGKSADTFCPIGPWLVTREAIPHPQTLRLWTKVNGQTMQNGTTADMIFSVAQLISYISEFMTLLPGDIIATGTPDGVGRGQTPPRYLQAGDTVELGIDDLGMQIHTIVSKQK